VYRALFVDRLYRHVAAVCSRGWGKTYLAGLAASTAVHELLEMPEIVPNKNVHIIGPTFDQMLDIYWPILAYDFGYLRYGNKNTGKFDFGNGVTLRLVSYEAIERMRGKGSYFVVNDEVSSWRKGLGFQKAWEDIIEPCITTRWSPKRAREFGLDTCGRSLTISTSNGYNYLYDMYNFAEIDHDWGAYRFDYRSSPLLDPNEIEKIKHRIDPLTFAREYLSSFKESGANVFYCFDRKLHVDDGLHYFDDHEDIHVGIDFNVGLQCTGFFALRGKQMHWLDECKGMPNTEELANYIVAKFPGRSIIAFPDPTGNSRKTSAPVGVTDFRILKSKGIRVCARSNSPGITDSVAAVNSKLKTAAGDIGMLFHPRCKGIIRSMERTVWVEGNPNLAVIDKSKGEEHFSDLVRYPTEYLFSLAKSVSTVSKQTDNF